MKQHFKRKGLPGRLISREFFEDSPESGGSEAAREAAGCVDDPTGAVAGGADCGGGGLSRAAQ